jgi:hypothetical protein
MLKVTSEERVVSKDASITAVVPDTMIERVVTDPNSRKEGITMTKALGSKGREPTPATTTEGVTIAHLDAL